MELSDIIPTPKIKRRSIFGDEEATSLEDSKIYAIGYRTCLETEIDLWMQQLTAIRKEWKTLKSRSEITVSQNIFNKEELNFFDHSLYYEYFNNVESFCNKVQCAREIKKQNACKIYPLKLTLKHLENQILKQL